MARTYIPALRRRLGLTAEELPDEATEEQITNALKATPVVARQQPRVTHDREPPRVEPQLTSEEREGVLMGAVEAGKFSAARAPHWRQQLLENPRGTAQVIAMLQPDPLRASEPRPGTAEHAIAAGRSVLQESQPTDEAYPAHWLGPDQQVTAQMLNPPTEDAQHGVLASVAEDNTSGYTSIPDEDGPYPSSWIGGTPELQEGPIGFEDPSMRGLSAKGLDTDAMNSERRRTKGQA